MGTYKVGSFLLALERSCQQFLTILADSADALYIKPCIERSESVVLYHRKLNGQSEKVPDSF